MYIFTHFVAVGQEYSSTWNSWTTNYIEKLQFIYYPSAFDVGHVRKARVEKMARIINTDAAYDDSKKYINECIWISEIGTLS